MSTITFGVRATALSVHARVYNCLTMAFGSLRFRAVSLRCHTAVMLLHTVSYDSHVLLRMVALIILIGIHMQVIWCPS